MLHLLKSENRPDQARIMFLVLARDTSGLTQKIDELKQMGHKYLVVCGEETSIENVVYRRPIGKYDAINFGVSQLPQHVDVVVMNDVDTKIHGFEPMLDSFARNGIDFSFASPWIKRGPQKSFYLILNGIRKIVPIAASGELTLARRFVLDKLVPLEPCKAEDTYLMFKALQLGYKVSYFDRCLVETVRTKSGKGEELYKQINVVGIYQALSLSRPPASVRLFYLVLPLFAPLLLVLGSNGYHWAKGILAGFLQYHRGDRAGNWLPTYLDA